MVLTQLQFPPLVEATHDQEQLWETLVGHCHYQLVQEVFLETRFILISYCYSNMYEKEIMHGGWFVKLIRG